MPYKNPEEKKEYNKQYREANKQNLSEQKKQYREDNKELVKESKKKHYEANKEAIIERVKKNYESNKEKIKEQKKQHYESIKQSNPLEVKLTGMIHSSIKADKKCNRIGTDLDYNFLLELWTTQEKLCYYCKCEMLLEFNQKTKNPQQITIQRLDNELAHTKANCVFACFDCNCNKYMELK